MAAVRPAHRDRTTAEVHFTLHLIELALAVVLRGDLSHFLVGRELTGPPIDREET